MGAQHGDLVPELRVHAGQNRDHVTQLRLVLVEPALRLEGLEPAAGVAARLQARGFELFADVLAGGAQPGAVEAAAFALGRRKIIDVGLEAFGGVARRRLGERHASRQRAERDWCSRLLQVDDERRVRRGPLALRDVGGLGPFEAEPGVLAVVGKLPPHAGDRVDRVRSDPADSELRVVRVAAREHKRMAREGQLALADADAGGAHLQSEGRVGAEQLRGEAVLAAEQPHAAVRRQRLQLAVRDDGDLARGARPGDEHRAPRFRLGSRLRRHHRRDLARAEELADARRRLARIEDAEHVEFRVHGERLRRRVGLDGEGRGGVAAHDTRDDRPGGGRDDDRHLDLERPGLALADHAGDGMMGAARVHLHVGHHDVRRAGTIRPLVEEALEVLTRRLLEHAADIGEARALAAVLLVEGGERLAEGVVADLTAQHVEAHQRLAVADGLGGGAVPRAELAQREVAVLAREVAVLLQSVAAVLRARCPRPP